MTILDGMSFIFSDNSSTLDELSQMLDELSKVTFGASCHFGRVGTLTSCLDSKWKEYMNL